MRNTFTIACREFRAYFTSPMAYVVMVFFLFFTGLLFTLSIGRPGAVAEMRGLLGSMVFMSLMLIPFVTMSVLAQERASGTLEMLLTKPVRDLEVVMGKYAGALGVFLVMICATLIYPMIMDKYGDLDWGPTWVGYLGVVLVGIAFIAIGVFASSLTKSQMAAAGISLAAFLFVWLIGWVSMLVENQTSWLAQSVKSISVFEVVGDFEKGLLDTKNVVYCLSLAAFFLFMTVRVMETRRQV